MTVTASRVDAGAGAIGLPAQDSATTDDLGEFRLAGLSSGRYEVWAGQEIEMIVPVDPGALVGIALTGSGGIGTNRASVRVRVGSGPKSIVPVETAEEVGGVQLTAPAESGADAVLRLISPDGPVRAVAQPTPQVTLPPRGRAAGIRGSVLSAARKPIAGASVRIAGSGVDQTVRTDKAGAFALIGLTSGRYTLEATANGFMSWNYGQQGHASRADRSPSPPIRSSRTSRSSCLPAAWSRADRRRTRRTGAWRTGSGSSAGLHRGSNDGRASRTRTAHRRPWALSDLGTAAGVLLVAARSRPRPER